MTPLRDLLAAVQGEDELTVGAAAILDLERLGVNVAEIDRDRERYRRALECVAGAKSLHEAQYFARLALDGWTPTLGSSQTAEWSFETTEAEDPS